MLAIITKKIYDMLVTSLNSLCNKNVPSRHFPLNITFCSSLNFSICSFDEKFNSLETDLHFSIFLGTRAEKCNEEFHDTS